MPKKRVHPVRLLLLLLVALAVSPSAARAQTVVTATINGFVHDKAGAAVSDATVTVTNTATGEQRQLKTDANGEYTAAQLPIGVYTVSVEQPGFKKFVQENVELHVNDRRSINVDLEPGNISETVTVTASVPLVRTESQSVEALITGTQVRELPLNNRNFAQLPVLAPGVSSLQPSTIGFGGLATVAVSVNGQRSSSVNWSVDGARNVDTGSNATLFNYPSVDAIAEFKVLTNSYDAQFGRNGGGVINVVTRSGGNEFHGGLYEFFRNEVLNARDPFQVTPIRGLSPAECFAAGANPTSNSRCKFKPPFKYNNFGYNVGGPVFLPRFGEGGSSVYNGRNRTFFFWSQEWRRLAQQSFRSGTFPTATQRAGVFSTTIRDPLTGQPFPNNTIPAARFDPNAVAIMQNFIPLPNSPSDSPTQFRTAAPSPTNFRQELIRLDHNFSDDWRIWGRYVRDNTATQEAGGLFNGLVFPGVATTDTVTPAENIVVRLTTVISPNLLNEVGYDFAKNEISSQITGNGLRANFPSINIPEVFPGSPSGSLPGVVISGFSSPLAFFGPFQNDNPSHTFTDNVTWNHGTHTFRFGGLVSREAKNENSGGNNPAGVFTFNGSATGNAFADFLLGRASAYVEDTTDVTVHLRYNTWEWYAQDSWKVNPKLTLNYGLRHSMFQNPTDEENLLISFLPRLYNRGDVRLLPNVPATTGQVDPASPNRFTGTIFAGDNSPYGRYVQTNYYDTFGPRLGLAYDVFGNGRTVVRTGYGVYFDRSLVGIVEQNAFSNPRANRSVAIDNPLLSNPGGGAARTALFPVNLTTTSDPFKVPTIQHWNLTAQHQFGSNMSVEFGYVGSAGRHLLHTVQINRAAPLAASRAGLPVNYVRPFVGYGNINERRTDANSDFHSLQTAFRRRLSQGLQFDVVYTFAKTLTTASDDRGDQPQDPNNLSIERGRASYQRPHILTINYLYEVPFPKSMGSVLNQVLGGWQVSGITYLWSGRPLTIVQSGDLLGTGSAGLTRPNLVADPHGPETVAQWFNTGAFAPATTTFGTSGRGIVLGPGIENFDITFVKNFRFNESTRLQFRSEFFNAFNHTQYSDPNTSATFAVQSNGTFTQTNANFGRITSVGGGTGREPRVIQFGLKLYF